MEKNKWVFSLRVEKFGLGAHLAFLLFFRSPSSANISNAARHSAKISETGKLL